jgi:hypothetical protein
MASESTSLDVDVSNLSINDPSDNAQVATDDVQSPKSPTQSEGDVKERKKPYINHERVKTGGSQRVR